ncbi:hypothetical protein V1478_014105 [Vespula squamosa]|uniref:Uncharacterized protein n=1 Tax=Vespula squamosa TaxID=30214 RepID=A0ABD2A721_VESSQ
MNEQQPDTTMARVTEEDRKDNKEPEPASPGRCSQAINNKTVATDTPDTMLNKINSISWSEKFRESFEVENNAEYDETGLGSSKVVH